MTLYEFRTLASAAAVEESIAGASSDGSSRVTVRSVTALRRGLDRPLRLGWGAYFLLKHG